jgi:uncharacterized protein YegL
MTNYTDLNIILDRSGSMQSIAKDMVGGLTSFLEKEKESGDDTRVSLFRFDGHYEKVFSDVNIKDDPKIELKPGGSTALMDAIGKTIQHVEEKLSGLLEEEKPNRILFLIITDGEENSSVMYNATQIKTMLSDKREKLAWDFVFMGVDEGAVMEQRQQIGVYKTSSLGFEKSSRGIATAFAQVSDSYSNYKKLDRSDVSTYCCSFEVPQNEAVVTASVGASEAINTNNSVTSLSDEDKAKYKNFMDSVKNASLDASKKATSSI